MYLILLYFLQPYLLMFFLLLYEFFLYLEAEILLLVRYTVRQFARKIVKQGI